MQEVLLQRDVNGVKADAGIKKAAREMREYAKKSGGMDDVEAALGGVWSYLLLSIPPHLAQTWEYPGSIITCSASSLRNLTCSNAIRQHVRDATDAFINDFLKMNPR
jgi:hypothetical protein